MIKRIWAFLTRGELVWLMDDDATVTMSIARINPWGKKVAERHWPYKIRTVELLDGGIVNGSYVKYWKPVREARRDKSTDL